MWLFCLTIALGTWNIDAAVASLVFPIALTFYSTLFQIQVVSISMLVIVVLVFVSHSDTEYVSALRNNQICSSCSVFDTLRIQCSALLFFLLCQRYKNFSRCFILSFGYGLFFSLTQCA